MAISLQSPGIKITEVDQITNVGSVGTTTGASVGEFSWGPINYPTLVTGEQDLVSKFGAPSTSNNVDFLCASSYLAYSASQYIVRVANGALNAVSGATAAGILVENDDAYDGTTFVIGTHGEFIARHAGALGNAIKVVVAATATAHGHTSFDSYRGFFDVAPGTSDYAAGVGASDDEMNIAVIDATGQITGVPGTLLEKYELVSKASDARGIDGGSNFYKTVINAKSKYIRVAAYPATSDWGTAALVAGTPTAYTDDGGLAATTAVEHQMEAGVDGTVSDAERVSGLGEYENKLNTSVDVIICGPGGATVANEAARIAGLRKDCVAVFSVLQTDVVSNAGSEVTDIETWEASVASARGTYSIADSNWKYAYDKYNDAYVWVPCNPDVAGCIARVDANRDPWFSPAGYENGRIQNAIRLAWNPNQTERDTLYKLGINSIISQPGRGTVLFGDKTFTQKKTSFSRINVRRLFITMEDVIGDAAGDVLFDQNDESLREGFASLVEAYLTTVQAGRGITQFKVVCDDSNNPTEVVQANEFVCDIFVQPTTSVNFIQLNFVSAAGDTAFTESE